jgi:hypothetical protein
MFHSTQKHRIVYFNCNGHIFSEIKMELIICFLKLEPDFSGGIHVFAGASAIGLARVATSAALAIRTGPNQVQDRQLRIRTYRGPRKFGSELCGARKVRIRTFRCQKRRRQNFSGPASTDPTFPGSLQIRIRTSRGPESSDLTFWETGSSDPDFPG